MVDSSGPAGLQPKQEGTPGTVSGFQPSGGIASTAGAELPQKDKGAMESETCIQPVCDTSIGPPAKKRKDYHCMFNSRKQGYRYTLQISRGPKAFQPILWASWSPTPGGPLETCMRKSGHLLETHEHHRLRNMFRKEEPSIDMHTAVSIVHQIYGVFRDGQPMCDTFVKSTMAWKTWCDGLPAKYGMPTWWTL